MRERDRDRIERQTVHEVRRAVDRIDDPDVFFVLYVFQFPLVENGR